MKKFLCVIAVLILGLFTMVGCTDKPPKEENRYFLTYEQETEMENSIKKFLKEQNLYSEIYTGIHINSGCETVKGEEVVKTEKTEIIIFVTDDIASNFSEAQVLNSGYYSAMTLYFGTDDLKNYNIVFQVFNSARETVYKFVNGEYDENVG